MSKVIKGGGSSLGSSNAQRSGYSSKINNRGGAGVISGDEVKARSKAQQIVQQAEAEAEKIRQQAEEYRQRGYEEGYAEGMEQGKLELTETILQINRQNQERFQNYETELVKLSMRIAEKIVGEQVKINPELVVGIVTKALGNVRHQREIYVRVSPQDYETVQAHKPQLLDRLSRAQDIDIRPDNNIAPGSCRIESELGTIDANLKHQMAAIERALLGE